MKRTVAVLGLWAALAFAPALPAATGPEMPDLQPLLCSVDSSSPALDLEGAVAWEPRGVCPQSFCQNDEQCACEAAQSYACSGSVCTYTYPGGGSGGGGGGGIVCPQSFCQTSSQCTCNGRRQGFCSGNRCQY